MALSIEQIRRTADRVAASQNLDIVEIEYLGGTKHRVLRIFIEQNREQRARRAEAAKSSPDTRMEAGSTGSGFGDELPSHAEMEAGALDRLAWVTHEDCERFSRDFGTMLDVEDLVPGSEYTLEVSSPGLDRKLAAQADYERFKGSLVKVQTILPLSGNRHWQGRLTEVNDGGFVLDLTPTGRRSRKKGTVTEQTLEIAFANVQKANLVPEF